MLRGWDEKRRDLGVWNSTYKFMGHSHVKAKHVHHVWSFADNLGSTSMFAVKVGLFLGYSAVVLCGVPYDDSGRFFDPPGASKDYVKHNKWAPWEKFAENGFDGRVKSMSGKTRELLGEP